MTTGRTRSAALAVGMDYFELRDVGLVDRLMLGDLPPELAARLDALLAEAGR
ncbi:MAG: hypothetical protein MUF48_05510 [Pirellulaceae bacterium]|nr:hypothetical protein [Pirellulaceae bacterium]